eukprot:gene5242-biopygen13233
MCTLCPPPPMSRACRRCSSRSINTDRSGRFHGPNSRTPPGPSSLAGLTNIFDMCR